MAKHTRTSAPARRAPGAPTPTTRPLRAFAYDPSLTTEMANYEVSEVIIPVRWERDREWLDETGALLREPGLLPGPTGDYLEVVDVDPASGLAYPPVDLNHVNLLATNGLAPSEGNPQFHQQMVYAVAMATIQHFERALGRQVFWSVRRVDVPGRKPVYRQVQRLRVYPHALREENAYYDAEKKALLFGYFPSRPALASDGMSGGLVFSCLSHDIVAHETTHAILDGMQRYFLQPDNVDVLAFHEAFADLVALLQHFTYPEILRHQIARARGNLTTETLLGQLALQFGRATGRRGALRDAIGAIDRVTGAWTRGRPKPDAYVDETEPHARGALLVGSLFDAFLAIYRTRTSDLLRIATGGTGVLPEGDLHPDLVGRLAGEAAKSAEHLLLMCIRAIDYCPPVDLTYGDYMRALITADYDLVPDDARNYRVAIIEAFRAWGIYPRDVRTLSVESLRWGLSESSPAIEQFSRLLRPVFFTDHLRRLWDEIANTRAAAPDDAQRLRKLSRMEVAERVASFSAGFHDQLAQRTLQLLRNRTLRAADNPFGLNIGFGHPKDCRFEVHQVRPVRRQGPDGQMKQDLLIQITQRRPAYLDDAEQTLENARYATTGGRAKEHSGGQDYWFRGGVTLIMDLESFDVRYAIQKNILSADRLARFRAYVGGVAGTSLRELYFGALDSSQRLAALHLADD